MTTVSALSPCFQAFIRERALPPLVLGPVLRFAFARLAAICFSLLILYLI
jgi:hypothetical protein